MVKEKLVATRVAVDDGRSTEVFLTDAGRFKLDARSDQGERIGRQAFWI